MTDDRSKSTDNGIVRPKKEEKEQSFRRLITFATDTKDEQPPADKVAGGLKMIKRAGKGFSTSTTAADKQKLKEENMKYVILPWSRKYKAWWGFTVICSLATVFYETYAIAFQEAGLQTEQIGMMIFQYGLTVIFVLDIIITFNLAAYDDDDVLVYHKKDIAKLYRSRMLWYDVVSVFPFYTIILAIIGQIGEDNNTTRFLSLIRLLRLIRLHRVRQVFEILQYSTKVSLMTLTLTRNLGFALVWTHFNACVMYFVARQYDYRDDETWIGGRVYELSGFERYLTTLYWSIVTFTTVGYGDFSPVNAVEQALSIIYMLLNIIFLSWMIGSITLIIVKRDEQTSALRESLSTLQKYVEINGLQSMHKRLKAQLKLDHESRSLADDNEVLKNFPSPIRRKILKRLYGPALRNTNLMTGVREQFYDAFFAACSIELLGPGEEILLRGSASEDLYLIVEGTVKLLSPLATTMGEDPEDYYPDRLGSIATSSVADGLTDGVGASILTSGFVNDIEFFTESNQMHTVRTSGVVKVLVLSRPAYRILALNHPASIGRILKNLLARVQAINEALKLEESSKGPIPSQISGPDGDDGGEENLPSGGISVSQNTSAEGSNPERSVISAQTEAALFAVEELIQAHIAKQKDDQTTHFLFAASRDDCVTMESMLRNGFDPDSADYDGRTALMVAAMKGNITAIKLLIDYNANPNLTDMHNTTALLEAALHGHSEIIETLLKCSAKIRLSDADAASLLCQKVSEGDVKTLARLMQAKINVNASDYDKRTAQHIACAEGNLTALKALVEGGADLNVLDRWGHSLEDEAKSIGARPILEYLAKQKDR